MPLLQQDVMGVVASYLSTYNLRVSFLRVCKLWREMGMEAIQGTDCYFGDFGKFDTLKTSFCIFIFLFALFSNPTRSLGHVSVTEA